MPHSYVCLIIRDNGAGMDAEARRHAFEPFFTTKPPGGGEGLGLSIVKTIVRRHGGTTSLESALGAGTTVTVRLPVSRQTDATVP
jgi:two-component system NtrC family sensor kinase